MPIPSVRILADKLPELAMADLWTGLRRRELWWLFAVHDIKQRFRRSVLGPFWLTLSMGVMVAALGAVFGRVFSQDLDSFLAYLAVGLIFWSLITGVITEGCRAFMDVESNIQNIPMPLSSHVYRVLARNFIIWLHNMLIYVIVFLFFRPVTDPALLLFVPAFLLLMVNLAWMGLLAAILSTRFRDVPPIIVSVLQIVFFVTPIFWTIEVLPARPAFVDLNPFYHLIEIVRAPLLGHMPDAASWAVAGATAAAGIPLAVWAFRRAYPRIPYWV